MSKSDWNSLAGMFGPKALPTPGSSRPIVPVVTALPDDGSQSAPESGKL